MMRTGAVMVRKGINGNEGTTHFECLRVILKGVLRSLYTVRTLDSSSTLAGLVLIALVCQAVGIFMLRDLQKCRTKINTLRFPLISVPSVSVLPVRSYTSTSSACDSSSRVSGVRGLVVLLLEDS
jgi:hypothetical protein